MKLKLLMAVAGLSVAMNFTGCMSQDRLDDIVKDLNNDSYSLNFDKTYPDYGITKTSYGAESFLVYADPQDVICGEPLRVRYPGLRVPVYQIPKIVQPTCPTMIPIDIATRIQDLLIKADATTFSGLKQIKLEGSKNVLLANETFTAQYASLKPDMIDDSVLNTVDANKYLLLQSPANMTSGFTRGFYGNANLDDFMTRDKIDFFHIFRPVLIGCFDPQILTLIKNKMAMINPAVYKSLEVTPLQQDSAVAVLSLPH